MRLYGDGLSDRLLAHRLLVFKRPVRVACGPSGWVSILAAVFELSLQAFDLLFRDSSNRELQSVCFQAARLDV